MTIELVFLCIFNMNISITRPGDHDQNRDRYQSLGPEMTGTGTNHRDQKRPVPGLVPVPVKFNQSINRILLKLYDKPPGMLKFMVVQVLFDINELR